MQTEIKKFWHRLLPGIFTGNSVFSLAVFFILFLGTFVLHAEPVSIPCSFPDDSRQSGYSSILSRNRECEAPVLRSRLGQQLQLNARTSRSGSQHNLQRNESTGNVLFESAEIKVFSFGSDFVLNANKASSYEVYSQYTLPVRAGPVFFND